MDNPSAAPVISVLSTQYSVLDRVGAPGRLSLTIGQQVRARVLEVAEGVVRLSVDNQTVAAETRASLAAGDQIRLQVRNVTAERVEFQLLDGGNAPAALRQAGRADLASLLESLGLATSATNLAVVDALLAQGQPVSRANVQDVARALGRAQAQGATEGEAIEDPALDSADVRAAVYLKAHNLPLSPAALALARGFLDASAAGGLGEKVQGLQEQLTTILEKLPTGDASGARSAAPFAETLRQVATALPLLSESRALADRPQLAATLQKLVQTLGTSLEHKLADVAVGRLPAAEATRDLRALVSQALAQVEGELATPGPDLSAGPRPSDAALQQLRATLQGLGDHLAGQQLANLAEPTSPLAPGYYLVQIPVAGQPGEKYGTAELQIYQSPDQSGGKARPRIDPENVRIVFRLAMSQLQDVEVDLYVAQRHLSCRISSASEDIRQFIDERAADLRDGLTSLGYSVDDVRCVPAAPPSTSPDAGTRGRGDAATAMTTRVLRVDARA